MLFIGKSSFNESKAGRLLRCARVQYASCATLDQMLASYKQLVQSGAELPSWAASCVPHPVSWASLTGIGSIRTSLAVAGSIIVTAVLLTNPTPTQKKREPKQNANSFATTRIAETVRPVTIEQTTQVRSRRTQPESRDERPDDPDKPSDAGPDADTASNP